MAKITPVGILPQVSFPEFVDTNPAMPLNIAPILQMNEIQRQAKEKAQASLDSQLDYVYKLDSPFERGKETIKSVQDAVYKKSAEFAENNLSPAEMHKQARELKHSIMTNSDLIDVLQSGKRYEGQLATREALIKDFKWDPFGYADKEMAEAKDAYESGEHKTYQGSALRPYKDYNESLIKLGKDLVASDLDLGKEINTFQDGEGNVIHTFNRGVSAERILGALSEQDKQTMAWEYEMAKKHNINSITINTYDDEDNITGTALKPFGQYVMDKVAPIAYSEFKSQTIGKGGKSGSGNSSIEDNPYTHVVDGTYSIGGVATSLFEDNPFDTYAGLKANKAKLKNVEKDLERLEAAYEAGDQTVWNEVTNLKKEREALSQTVDVMNRSADALKQSIARTDPKFADEFEKSAASLLQRQAALLTESEKYYFDKYGAILEEAELRGKTPIRKGDTQTPIEARKKQVTQAERTMELAKQELGSNFSEAEYKQAVRVMSKLKGFKGEIDEFNDKVAEYKKADDNSRVLDLPVLNIEFLSVTNVEKGRSEKHNIGEMVNQIALAPSMLAEGEIYVLANEVTVSSSDGADLNTRTTKSLTRGDKLNPNNNEIPIGSIDDKTMKAVGLTMSDIPGKGIGVVFETYGPSSAEEGAPKNAITGRYIVFPSKGNQALMLNQVGGLLQKTDDERLRALSAKFKDRKYDEKLSEFYRYKPADEATIEFDLGAGTKVKVNQFPSEGTDRNFRVDFETVDPDSGELLEMTIPNPIHNLNDVEQLLENFDTKKLIEGNIARPESEVGTVGDMVPPGVENMPDPYNHTLFKTQQLRTFIGTAESQKRPYNTVQDPYPDNGKLIATDAIGKHQFKYSTHKPEIIKSLNSVGITNFEQFTPGKYSAEYAELASNPVTNALPAEDKKVAAAFLSSGEAQIIMMDSTIDNKYRKQIPAMIELSEQNADKHGGRVYTVPEIVSLLHYGPKNAERFIENGALANPTADREVRKNLGRIRESAGMTEVKPGKKKNEVVSNIKEKVSIINSSPELDDVNKAHWNQVLKHSGVKWVSGQENADKADCSGFCLSIMENLNYNVPKGVRSAAQMAAATKAIPFGNADAVIAAQDTFINGTLLFRHKPGTGRIDHVAMVLKDEKGETYLAESDQYEGGFNITKLADRVKKYSKGAATFSAGFFTRKK